MPSARSCRHRRTEEAPDRGNTARYGRQSVETDRPSGPARQGNHHGQSRTLRSTTSRGRNVFVISAAVLGVLGWMTNVVARLGLHLATLERYSIRYAPVSIITGSLAAHSMHSAPTATG